MSDSIKIQEILEKIEVEKEILSTMPKNNAKNTEKYIEKIIELKKEYEKYEDQIEKIFKKRYKKLTDIKQANDIENLEIRLNTIENTLYLLSDEKTSYEKMKLDKIIYKIGRYYKDNLENINKQIEEAIKKFDDVGIKIGLSDFDYSIYVEQYMKVFFAEKGNINSTKLKTTFEEVYWKCPDLIIHIELNLRNIYLKKQVQVDKYFEKEKNELLKKWEKTPKQIMDSYLEIKMQKEEKLLEDKKLLLESFLNGKLNTNDYTDDKVQANYSKMLTQEKINETETQKSIFEFLNSLKEYKNYLYFKFIIDDVKKHYNQRENYKKVYEDTKKKIDIEEKKLKKLNKRISKKGLFGRKAKEIKQSAEQNQIIMEIKKLYKELDLNKFYNKIYTELGENSTIYEALNLANSYYNYLTNCMIENNKTITQEKIDEQIRCLDNFLKNPYNNIINNLTIAEEKDVAMIIKDRYKLLSFNIEKEDFSTKSVDGLISTLENIITGIALKRTNLKVKEIEEITDSLGATKFRARQIHNWIYLKSVKLPLFMDFFKPLCCLLVTFWGLSLLNMSRLLIIT